MVDKTDLAYLAIGVGLGFSLALLQRWRSRSARTPRLRKQQPKQASSVETAEPPPSSAESADLRTELQQTKLAYYQAVELGKFKAGFLARTSHELRSPLSSMMGIHQIILSDLCENPEEEREFVEQLHKLAADMMQLMDHLIEVSKVDQGLIKLDIQPVQLLEILQEVDLLTRLPAKNRNLRLEIAQPNPAIYVMADPNRLRQILVGLVSQIIAQMHEGDIKISAEILYDRGYALICFEDLQADLQWAEPIDLMSIPLGDLQISDMPGLQFTLSQILLEAIGGQFCLAKPKPEPQSSTATGQSQDDSEPQTGPSLQCWIPLVMPDLDW